MNINRRLFLACAMGALSAEDVEIAILERQIHLNDIEIQRILKSIVDSAKSTSALIAKWNAEGLVMPKIHGANTHG